MTSVPRCTKSNVLYYSHPPPPDPPPLVEFTVFTLPSGRGLLINAMSDHNIFCTLKEERTTVGSNAPGAFLVSCLNAGAIFFKLNLADPALFYSGPSIY